MLPSYILFTALSVQFIYILINWYFFRRKEYVFYSIYILVISLYFLNKYLADDIGIVHIGSFDYFKVYPDKILAILSYFFYFKFARYFTVAHVRYPFIDRVIKILEHILLGFILFDILLLSFTGNTIIENYIFLPVNILIFVVLIFVFRKMIIRNEVLDRFILTGSMCYAVCACITMWLGQNRDPMNEDHILALQIGAIIEMILLNAGLVYKSRMLQSEKVNSQMQLIEKYRENEELILRLGDIREKISRDLHDDIGGELSAIRLLSEIKTPGYDPQEQLTKISAYSGGMVQKLNEIVWALNFNNDTLQSLLAYIRRYAVNYLDDLGISCLVRQPEDIPGIEVDGPTRRHIFLLIKEALNNIVKHAEATKVYITIIIHEVLSISIGDNGKGISPEILNKVKGNGLNNMSRRVAELKGSMEIKNHDGTTLFFSLPVLMHNTKG